MRGRAGTPADPVMAGKQAFGQDRYPQAVEHFRAALKKRRDDPEVLHLLGIALTAMGDPKSSIEPLRKALKHRPTDTGFLIAMANSQRLLARPDDAHRTLNRVLRNKPAHGGALYLKAMIFRQCGQPEDALELLEPHIKDGLDEPNTLLSYATLCRDLKRPGETIDRLRAMLGRPQIDPILRRSILFEIGHAHDALKQYDEAFEFFTKANDLAPPTKVTPLGRFAQDWSPQVYARVPAAQNTDDRPVFIIGMPRSGTTLAEQILASHPKVHGIGESVLIPTLGMTRRPATLDQRSINELGQKYSDMLDGQVPGSATRVIDKMPHNYRHVGFITKALPKARIIHMLRDPRDCCLSCFFQNFVNSVPYSGSLDAVGKEYVVHRKLIDYYKKLSGCSIFELNYEQLVAEPEATVREVLAFLGLEYDAACLKFHEKKGIVLTASASQVRRPINKSGSQRWRNYQQHLGPLLSALGPYAPSE